jgi:tRNA threonylcarbamoyl adenosine modification protein YeaZ/ribosomal-protein-alanine acetyltransferase
MKVLGIDSSGLTATVALMDEKVTIASYTINHKKTHSVTLLPMIEEMLTRTGIDLDDIDGIIVSGGPGSFTGLRIGTATAKGLGLALNKPLISIPTTKGLAYQLYGFEGLICPIMDARRNQVYTGLYTFQKEENTYSFKVVKEQFTITIDELIKELNQEITPQGGDGLKCFEELSKEEVLKIQEKGVIFLGDGVPIHKEALKDNLKRSTFFAPSYLNRQNAAALGALGIHYLKEGKVISANEFKPEYLRVAQAERERKVFEEASQVTIRKSEPEDIVTILEIERENFSDPWSIVSITETFNQPYNICLTAQKVGKVVGYLFASLIDTGEILAISVSKDVKRQGVGRSLINELIINSQEKGIKKLTLEVRESNQEALSFYEDIGFKRDGIRKEYYKDPKEDGILMSLEL